MRAVRTELGEDIDFQYVHDRLMIPNEVYIFRDESIKSVVGYSRKLLGNRNCLVAEGITLIPAINGNEIFGKLTKEARSIGGDNFICTATTDPVVYRALADYCNHVYPGKGGRYHYDNLKLIIHGFAESYNCKIDSYGVIRGKYGDYCHDFEPHKNNLEPLFEVLGMKRDYGDSLLVVGDCSKQERNYCW